MRDHGVARRPLRVFIMVLRALNLEAARNKENILQFVSWAAQCSLGQQVAEEAISSATYCPSGAHRPA